MKRFYLLLLIALLSFSVCCSPIEYRPVAVKVETSDIQMQFEEAKQAVELLCHGCNSNAILVSRPHVMTVAHVYHDEQIVIFNPIRMKKLAETHGQLVYFTVFAHEMGHILIRGLQDAFTMHQEELFADRISGCATAIRGYPPETGAAMLASFTGGLTHPNGQARAASFLYGYQSCK